MSLPPRTLRQAPVPIRRRRWSGIRGKDPYGRFLAYCVAAEKDIAGLMVRLGWALAHCVFSYEYSRAEQHAKSAQLGIWASEFKTRSEWRKRTGDAE
jgi:endonuclease YncB( thermonuclease family)